MNSLAPPHHQLAPKVLQQLHQPLGAQVGLAGH